MKHKIYVASSWRNSDYPEVVEKLREAGHDVYDFRNPPSGDESFKWSIRPLTPFNSLLTPFNSLKLDERLGMRDEGLRVKHTSTFLSEASLLHSYTP